MEAILGGFIMLFVLYFALGVVFAIFCSNVADKKNLNSFLGGIGGFFFSFIALVAVAGMPHFNSKHFCPRCKQPVFEQALKCHQCGTSFESK